MQCRIWLDFVIRQRAIVFKLRTFVNQLLLMCRNVPHPLNPAFETLYGEAWGDLQREILVRWSLDGNLQFSHVSKMQCRLLLYIVCQKSPPVLQSHAAENELLLIRRNAKRALDLRLDVADCVAGLREDCEGLWKVGQILDEDLHVFPPVLNDVCPMC